MEFVLSMAKIIFFFHALAARSDHDKKKRAPEGARERTLLPVFTLNAREPVKRAFMGVGPIEPRMGELRGAAGRPNV